MAIVWQKNIKGSYYEVRRAGNTVRLYSNGVFHSQYNPQCPITRSIWDLLMLPAFFYPIGSVKRVLVLGVGGGSVIQLVHRIIKPRKLIGIELVPIHISIAKRFFNVDKNIATIHEAEAVDWLSRYTGPPFDLIIDDLFGEAEGEGKRAVDLDRDWFNLLYKNLSVQAILVFNLLSNKAWQQSAFICNRNIANRFKSVYQFTLPQYHNKIMALLTSPSSVQAFRENLQQYPNESFRRQLKKLPYRITKIK